MSSFYRFHKPNDRVDISLDTYKTMENRINELEAENKRLKVYFDRFKFPYDMPINPDSIEIFESNDIDNIFKRKYMIRFEEQFEFDMLK